MTERVKDVERDMTEQVKDVERDMTEQVKDVECDMTERVKKIYTFSRRGNILAALHYRYSYVQSTLGTRLVDIVDIRFFICLFTEMAPHGVRVNAIK